MFIKRIISVILILFLLSCSEHHEMENITLNIASSDKNKIDEKLLDHRMITSWYLDSTLNGKKPSIYFQKAFEDFFGENIYIVKSHNHLGKTKYYEYLDESKNKILITLIDEDVNSKIIEFYFQKRKDIWMLKDIILNNH